MAQIEKIKQKWVSEKLSLTSPASIEDITWFESKNQVILPTDLVNFYTTLNGTKDEYDGSFFQFYSIRQLKNVMNNYEDWNGIPEYRKLINTLPDVNTYFVIANYFIHLFCYVIKLSSLNTDNNEILVVCGDSYKKIANSFTEFLELYLDDSIELQMSI